MVGLMNRSIDILEELARESDNLFHLNRRGYLFVTADPARIPDFERAAEEPCALGAGALRVHTGGPGDPDYIPAPAHGFRGPAHRRRPDPRPGPDPRAFSLPSRGRRGGAAHAPLRPA